MSKTFLKQLLLAQPDSLVEANLEQHTPFEDSNMKAVIDLQSLLETGLVRNQFNVGTAALAFLAMESFGCEIHTVAMVRDTINPQADLHTVAMEGLGKFIGDKIRAMRERSEKKKLDKKIELGKTTEHAEDVQKKITDLLTDVDKLPVGTKVSIKIGAQASIFNQGGQLVHDLPQAVDSFEKTTERLMVTCIQSARVYADVIEDFTATLDLRSDKAFEASLTQLSKLKGHFVSDLSGQKELDLLDGVRLLPNPEVQAFNKAKGVEQLGCLGRVYQHKMDGYVALKESDKEYSLSKEQLHAMLKSAELLVSNVIKHGSDPKAELTAYGEMEANQFFLYLVEVGGYTKDARLIPNLNTHRAALKELQSPVIPGLDLYSVMTFMRGLQTRVALATYQVVRRAVAEAK